MAVDLQFLDFISQKRIVSLHAIVAGLIVCGLSTLGHILMGRGPSGGADTIGQPIGMDLIVYSGFLRLVGIEDVCLGHGADRLPPDLAILCAQAEADHAVPFDILPKQWAAWEVVMAVLPLHDAVPAGVRLAELTKGVIQLSAVLLGDVATLDEALEHTQLFIGTKNKDLGHSDGVEPTFDPAPDGVEEARGADYEDTVQRLGVVGRGQRRGCLHVGLEIPELLEPNARDVDDVGAHSDGRPGMLAILQMRAKRHVESR